MKGDEKVRMAAENTLLDAFAATNPRPILEAGQAEKITGMAL